MGFEQDAGTIRVRVPGEEIDAEVLVGADGLHSVVRAQLHPDQGPLLWSGVRMWRGVTEAEPSLSGRSMAHARGRANTELVVYPIGPSQVNWVGLVPVAEPGSLPGDANWNHPGRAEDVLRYFGDWDLGWLDVLGLIKNSAVILEYPMVDRDPLPSWGQERVTLLGDATCEKTRREATAAVIAANREMRRTGDARSPEELARITETYRRVTDADS